MQKTCEYVLLDFKTVDYPEVIQKNDVQLVKTALLTQWPCHKNTNSKNNTLQFVEAYSMIPGKRPKETIMCISDYHVFSALYQNQKYNKTPTESWLNKMYDFFANWRIEQKNDDLINIMTYSYHGDTWINQYYDKKSSAIQHAKHSFMETKFFRHEDTNSFQYCLFEPQARAVLQMHEASLKDLDKRMQELDDNKWEQILKMYQEDMLRLYEMCPSLTEPMTVFRGETNECENGLFKSTIKTIKSFSLDPCVACDFSRPLLDNYTTEMKAGNIYMVTFEPESKLMFIGGLNCVSDIAEAECRAHPQIEISDIEDITEEVRPEKGWGHESLNELQVFHAKGKTRIDTDVLLKESWNIVRAIQNAR